MAFDFVFEDPFDDSLEAILQSLFEQVEVLWPDPNNRPDLREGSLMWTLLSPVAFEVQRFQSDLNLALEAGFLQFTFGNFLDLKGVEFGLPRKQGSKAGGILRFLGTIGTAVPTGTTASTVAVDEDDETYLYDTTDSGIVDGVEDPTTLNETQFISLGGSGRFQLFFDGALVNLYDLSGPAITGTIIESDLDGLVTPNFTNVQVSGDSGILNAGGATIVFDGGTPYVPANDVAGRDVPLMTFVPYDVNEIQSYQAAGGTSFKVTFDTVEGATVLTPASTGAQLVAAINLIGIAGTPTYGQFAVSTTTPAALISAGVLITFDVGGVQYQDVPLLQCTSKVGLVVETISQLVQGEDSTVQGEVTELVKGRTAPPTTTTTDQNEIEEISFTPVSVKVSTPITGVAGAKNEKQRLTITGWVGVGGGLQITFNNGMNGTSDQTVLIPAASTAASIQVALEALTNVNIGDILVTNTGGGPSIATNGVFDIEFKNNLRYFNFVPLVITIDPLNVGSSAVISEIAQGAPGTNEKQQIEYLNGIPSGGTFDLTLQAFPGFLPSQLLNLPYNISTGQLQLLLEQDPLYGTEVPDTFVITNTDTDTTIRTAMEGMSNVDVFPQDVIVTSVSGGPTPGGTSPAIYEVEFVGALAKKNLQVMSVVSTTGSMVGAGAVAITTIQNGSPTQNEKQRITFTGVVGAGTVTIQFSAVISGTSFSVSGGPLAGDNSILPLVPPTPITIEFRGKNRAQRFRPIIITPHFTGTPTSGLFKLIVNGPLPSPSTSGPINFNALTSDVETALVAANNVAPGQVAVKVATGFQTLKFSTATVSGTLALTVDNGTGPLTTAPIAHNATAATVQAALELLANVGVGNVIVETSGGLLSTGTATYTVNFLTSHTATYKHMTTTQPTVLSPVTTIAVGPNLGTPGTAYEVEFLAGLGNISIPAMTYSTVPAEFTLSPQPNTPVIIGMQDGTAIPPAQNEKQLISLSHPSGYFKLGFGSVLPNRTAFISPVLDTFATIDHKIEALGSIGATNLTTLGGPIKTTPVTVEFSGGALGFIEQDLMTVHDSTVAGGLLVGPIETQKGFSTGVADTFVINFNDNAAAIQTAMEGMFTVGVGDVIVTPVSLTTTPQAGGAAYIVEFTGALAKKNFQLMTSSLNTFLPSTGVSITPVVNGSTTQNEKQKISFSGGPTSGSVTVTFNNAVGGAGVVSGVVQYGYSLVTKLGVQEGLEDVDFEDGYGATALGDLSTPINVTNKKILLSIEPVIRTDELTAIRKINIYRSLDAGDFRLIGTISEADISFTFLGDGTVRGDMFFIDNVPVAEFNAITDLAPTANTTGVLELDAEAQLIGEGQNVVERTIEFLEDAIAGIDKVTNPNPFGGGSDIETDDAYRQRLIEEAQKDPGAGNVDDYVSWAKQIAGVDAVSVIPEWQEIYGPLEGAGTVKVIVAGENSSILPATKVEEVRQFIAGTIAIPDPDQSAAPSALATPGGNIEDGIYEYVFTYVNVGRGETKASVPARVSVRDGNNTVELSISKGQGGLGVQNTVGRRIYRKKVDSALPGEPESDRSVLVAELLNNIDTTFVDDLAFADLPVLIGYPNGPLLTGPALLLNGPYTRRKSPIVNSTSIYDGEAPIGAHVTVEPITDETIWVNATIYPNFGYSVDGTSGTVNLTTQLDIALGDLFKGMAAGQDVKIIDVANTIHDHAGTKDFKDLTLFSPAFPTGTTDNIAIGTGVAASYSSAGVFTLWPAYPYDK